MTTDAHKPLPELIPYYDFDCEYTNLTTDKILHYDDTKYAGRVHIEYPLFLNYKKAIAQRLKKITSDYIHRDKTIVKQLKELIEELEKVN